MRSVAVALIVSLTFVAASCGGDGGAPTGTQTATPTNVASPSPGGAGPVPSRPSSFEDYPAAIASYLDKKGEASAISSQCADLVSAWQMPQGQSQSPGTTKGQTGCYAGNTDADSESEVIVSLTAGEPNEPLFTSLVVFERTDGGFDVSYQFSRQAGSVPVAFLDARNVNGDGVGDLAFAEITCGAHTCTWHVHVVSGEDGTYRELTPAEGLSLETADIRIDETDGDGSEEIIMHGGIIESVGAGPQRARTDIYAWDGATYTLRSSTKEPSDARLFRVQDADAAFAAGDFGEAATLYAEAVNDSSLQDTDGLGSREELMAYALFRLGLSRLKLGDTAAASDAIEQAIFQYPVSLHGKAAVEFRNASGLTQVAVGDIAAGCAAATASLSGEPDRFREIWNYGYANPGPALEDVCPF